MICLGIESTAHTFGVAVMKDENVLSNFKDSFTTETGGMIPFQLAVHHTEVCDKVIIGALSKAGVSLKDVELIAYSMSPGMGHALRVGAFFARTIASKLKIPIVGVNHCIAHLEIGNLLTGAKDSVMLYASGANTQIIAYEGGKYRIFGETLDQGVGNMLDSFAREMGLGFPGGPKIYELALKSEIGKKKGVELIELPYTVKGMDVSFGGLVTNLKQKYKSGKYKVEDLCYSLQETIFAMLLEVSERAMAHTGKKELLFGGGVCCNIRLQEMAKIMCEERGAKVFIPANEFLVDNAGMIAWLGQLQYKAGKRQDISNSGFDAYERTDEVKVDWK